MAKPVHSCWLTESESTVRPTLEPLAISTAVAWSFYCCTCSPDISVKVLNQGECEPAATKPLFHIKPYLRIYVSAKLTNHQFAAVVICINNASTTILNYHLLWVCNLGWLATLEAFPGRREYGSWYQMIPVIPSEILFINQWNHQLVVSTARLVKSSQPTASCAESSSSYRLLGEGRILSGRHQDQLLLVLPTTLSHTDIERDWHVSQHLKIL